MALDILHGLSVTFSSSFCAQITNASWSGITRDAVPTSNSSTSGGMTFIPSDLYDPGTLTISGYYDNTKTFVTPITGAAETVTCTMPLASGQSVANTIAASGFLTSFSVSGPTDGSSTAGTYEAVLKLSGNITFVAGS
jgi:hypothetical protein